MKKLFIAVLMCVAMAGCGVDEKQDKVMAKLSGAQLRAADTTEQLFEAIKLVDIDMKLRVEAMTSSQKLTTKTLRVMQDNMSLMLKRIERLEVP